MAELEWHDDEHEPLPAGLWVRSELMPTGDYGVSLSIGADRSWSLSREQATAYALACFERAVEVEHDTAVCRALIAAGIDDQTIASFIAGDLRPDRPDTGSATKPLRFTGAIGRHRKTGELVPLLHMQLDGQCAGQLTTGDLQQHAHAVLQALTAADLDAALHRSLTGRIGLNDGAARAMIGQLGEHWPTAQASRG